MLGLTGCPQSWHSGRGPPARRVSVDTAPHRNTCKREDCPQRVPEPLPRLARLDLKVDVINALAIVSCPFNGSQRPSAIYLPKKVWNKLFVAPKPFAPTKHAKHTTINFIITPTKLDSSLLVMGNKIKINCIEKLLEVSL